MQDVIEAWTARCEAEQALRDAEERYRETVRAALSDGVTQSSIAKSLDRTRESIRQDAMTDEERDALKEAAAARRREKRKAS